MLHLSEVPIDGTHVTDICFVFAHSICCDVIIWFWASDILKVGVFCHSLLSLSVLYHLSFFLSFWLSVFPSFYLSVSISVLLSFCLSVLVFLLFCLLFGHLSSNKFIFVQFHLSIFLSFSPSLGCTGLWSEMVLDGLWWSYIILGHLGRLRTIQGLFRWLKRLCGLDRMGWMGLGWLS